MKKMAKLSADQRRIMGESARSKMEREFDRYSIIDAYITEIKKYL